MKKNVLILLFLFVMLFCCTFAIAQQRYKVSGRVRDTTQVGVAGANIWLMSGKDTLSSRTDTTGRFSFPAVRTGTITVQVKSIGYLPFQKNYTLSAHQLNLPVITIKSAAQELSEVVIKAKIIPMRVLKDTLEFNAQAYAIREEDRVEDLLKQLPGMEIDKDGNASSAGKELTKIRVNGKDFFTGNVKQFIAELPANIVSKIQVIDDYGNEANFSGLKKGEPKKILNLVLKRNINKGYFSGIGASAGTNDRYAVNLNRHVWQETRQIGVNANASNTNTGAGINTNTNVGLNYRRSVNKKLVLSGGYAYSFNKSKSSNQRYIETTLPGGRLFDQSNSENEGKSNTHQLNLDAESITKLHLIRGSIRGTLAENHNTSILSSIQNFTQKDINRQDIRTNSGNSQKNPNLNADFSISRKFTKPGRNLSLAVTLSSGNTANTENQDNLIRYYDEMDVPFRDSVLNRLIDTRNQTKALTTKFTYTEPLNKPGDTVVSKRIDFSYDYSLNHTTNGLETQSSDSEGIFGRVDSLSNRYRSTFSTHDIELNYRYEAKKLSYSLGIKLQPNMLTGAYEGRDDKIQRSGLNVAPVARMSYKFSAGSMLNMNYNGYSTAPSFNQLQPVNDARNLQNIVIGNPDLKTSFNHSLQVGLRNTDVVSGRTLQLSLRGTTVQDQVVSNTILIPETIDGIESFRRETRYENINGNYGLGSNYSWFVPLEKKKYTLEVRGGLNYTRRLSLSDNQKNTNKGIMVNQGLSMRIHQKWMTMFTDVNYSYQSNQSSLAQAISNTVQTWLFNTDVRAYFLKRFTAGLQASKTFNEGYSVAASNPFLIKGYLERSFFKKRTATLKLEANDLLKQGNNLERVVSDNTITESQTNQITRYFLLSFNVRLQRFGG